MLGINARKVLFVLLGLISQCSLCEPAIVNVLLSSTRAQDQMIELAKIFEAERPGDKIQYVLSSADNSVSYSSVLEAGLSATEPKFDIVLLDIVWPTSYAKYLVDLKDYGLFGEAIKGIDSVALAADVVNGRQVAVPFEIDFGVLVYRDDLLRKYGYSSPPSTWSELENIALDIQAKERTSTNNSNIFGYISQLQATEGLSAIALEYIYSFTGKTVFNNETNVPDLTSQGVVDAIKKMKKHYDDIMSPDAFTFNVPTSVEKFRKGEGIFMRMWASQMIHTFSNLTVCDIENKMIDMKGLARVSAVPGNTIGGPRGGALGGWQMAIPKNSKNPEAASAAIKFFLSERAQIKLARAGFMVSNTTMYEQDDVCQATNICKVFPTLSRFSQFANYNELSSVFFNGINDILKSSEVYILDKLRSIEKHLKLLLGQDQSPCDYAGQEEYLFIERYDYAMTYFKAGIILALTMQALMGASFLFGLFFTIIKFKRKECHAINIVSRNISNYLFIGSSLAEFVFFTAAAMFPNMDWNEGDVTSAVVRVLQTIFGDLFFFNWVYMFLVILWVVYCCIYLLELADRVSEYYLGELFLAPSILYLQVLGTIGILPILGSLLPLYFCIFPPREEFEDAYILYYCEHKCYTTEWKVQTIISAIAITFYIPLTLLTSHFWQEMSEDLQIFYNRSYVIWTKLIYLYITIIQSFLQPRPLVYFTLLIPVFCGRLFYQCRHKYFVVNLEWLNPFQLLQTLCGIVTCSFALICHLSDVQSFWPLPVIISIPCILCGVGVFYVKRTYTGFFRKPKKSSSVYVENFARLLREYRHSIADSVGDQERKSQLPEEDGVDWEQFNNYCIAHNAKRPDRQILKHMINLGKLWMELTDTEEIMETSEMTKIATYLDAAISTSKQLGVRFRSKSLRTSDKRNNARINKLEDGLSQDSSMAGKSSIVDMDSSIEEVVIRENASATNEKAE
eukprot:Nk52_evm37s252 gene=Nk52_evmTU37s252